MRSIAGLAGTDEVMQHHSCFQAAEAALKKEPDASPAGIPARDGTAVPRWPGPRLFLSFLVAVSQDGGHLLELHQNVRSRS